MSSVDNRIVEMQFNNRRFEENAKETMSTLDKLKEKLNFKSSQKNLEDFQNTADSFNLDRMANAIEEIGNKFTMLGNLGQQTMQRIANAAINAGVSLVKSISVDQINAGMAKYEEETNTVQTLLASLKPKGKTKEDIYAGLEILAEYSDETSYSYNQMAGAVSNFVNAGQDFDRSITAMQGIANVAAKAGVSIQDAQIAFRNFSDAMGKGHFELQDWKSIQNIHMDAEWLVESLLDTAAELKKIQKDESGKYWIETGTGKKKKKEQIDTGNYRDFLRYGIFDKDVIMKNMEVWAKDAEAFAAAQNAKTFTDVMDAVKDSVSTSWKTTFRTIFGDVEEAIALFTPMANKIIEFTSQIGDVRNDLLKGWRDLGGRNNMLEVLNNLWDAFTSLSSVIGPAMDNAFNFGRGVEHMSLLLNQFTIRLANATRHLKDWITDEENGGERLQKIQRIFEGVFSVLNIGRQILVGIFTFFKDIFRQLKPTFDEIINLFSEIGGDIFGLNDQIAHSTGLLDFFHNLAKIFEPITKRLPRIIQYIGELYGRLKLFWNTNKRFVQFRRSVERLFNSFIKFVPKAIESVIEFGKKIVDMVKNSDEWKRIKEAYEKYLVPILQKFQRLATSFNNAISDFFDMDTSDENTIWGKIKKRFSAFEKLKPYLSHVWNDLKENVPFLQDVENWWKTDPIINEIKQWVTQIASAVDTFLSEDTSGETSIVGKIKQRFEAMWGELGPWMEEKWTEYKTKYPIFQQIEDFLKNVFGWGKSGEDEAQKTEESTEKMTGFLEGAWNAIVEFVSKIDPGKLILFGIAVKLMIDLYKKIKTLAGWASLGETIGETIEQLGSTLKEIRKTMKTSRAMQTITMVLEIAASIWLLGDTLKKVSELGWEEIGRGLAAMAGLFLEEGVFMVMLTKFNVGEGKIKAGQMIGIAASMWILGKALRVVSELGWEEIGRGLATMAGLFLEQGAFTIIVNRLGSTSIFEKKGTGALSMIGIAVSMMLLGNTLKSLSALGWDEIARGLTTMGGIFGEAGLFTILVNKLGSTSILEKKGANSFSMIATALMIKMLAGTLKDLAGMGWEEIKRGLFTMGTLFAESGAFMILVNRLSGGSKVVGIGSAIGTAGSIWILASKMKEISELSWEEIKKGLAAMAGLFAEEGAFMVIIGILSKKSLINPGAVNATTGILAGGIGMMADSMSKLGKMSLNQILKGALAMGAIEVCLGVFVALMSKIERIKFTNSASMILMAASIWIMTKAFEPLAKLNTDEIKNGVLGLLAVTVVLGIFCAAMSAVHTSIKTTLGVIVSAIALAALMVAFAFAISLIKDVDPKTIIAFGAAMILVSGAMLALSATLQLFSNMSVGAALKGTAIMLIAATGLAAAVAVILTITGSAIEGFSGNIAVVGANLAQYSDQVSGIDMTAVNNSITMIKDLATAFAEVGVKDYGKLDEFRSSMTRMGSSLKLFGMNTSEVDLEKMKSVTGALKDMATDLSAMPEVSDLSTSIGNIGGAIKLYSDSLNGTELNNVPDATSIKTVFDSLKGAIPNDEDLTEVAGYADEGKGAEMTNFAIGLTNIATAVSSFSESAKGLSFESIKEATDALTSISQINTALQTTSVARFGPFAVEVSEQKESLSTFAEDVVALGTALQAFGDNISKVKAEDLTAGADVLDKIAEVNKKLPKTGGVSSWLTGSQNLTNFAANLRLLGGGAKAFGEEVSGSTFDATAVSAAGDALVKIAEVNQKLPSTGGISSWFTGDETLSGFGSSLKTLGGGIKDFAEALGDTKITDDMIAAIGQIDQIANVQVKLSSAESWHSIATFGEELNAAATEMIKLNNQIKEVTWNDLSGFEHILSFATDQQVKLGATTYSKNLKSIGQDLKGFFEEIWNFTTNWVGQDTGKLDKVSSAVTSIFTSIGEAVVSIDSTGIDFTTIGEGIVTALTSGMVDDNSKAVITSKAKTLSEAIVQAIHPGNDQNFINAGTWVPTGFAVGILKNQNAAINAAKFVMLMAIAAARKVAGINSPSKVFEEMGMYSDQGFAQGMANSVNVVTTAAGNMSRSAIDTVLQNLANVENLPLDQMDITPTIRPVLDTSDISRQAGSIDGILGGTRNIGFNTRELEARAQIVGDQAGADSSSIMQYVNELSGKFDELKTAITSMQLVLNTGALVGGISSEMDRALGDKARLARRGV